MKRMMLATLMVCGGIFWVGCGGGEQDVTTGGKTTTPEGIPGVEPTPVGTPSKEVKVGVILPETGSIATYGQDTRRGLELAVRHANAAQEVKLSLIFQDNHSDPDKSRDLMRDLVTLQDVQAIIGAVVSSSTPEMVDIAKAKEVPIITPTPTNDAVTAGNPYVFQICYTDTYQGETMARFAREEMGAETAAVLEDYRSSYSKGLSKTFQRRFQELGGEVVSVRQFGPEDQDFSGHLSYLRGRRGGTPDVVVVPAYYEAVGKILRQAKEKGLECTFLGSDGWDSPELYTLAGENAKGHYFAGHFSQDDPDPRVQQFVKAYEQAYPNAGGPTALSALGYDAGIALADAVNRATELTGRGIRDAIAEIRDLDGVTGTITMDSEGNALKDIVILKTGTEGAQLAKRYPATAGGG